MAQETLTGDEIRNRVTYHAPSTAGVERHSLIATAIENALQAVNVVCPGGREKSLAFTKLEEAKFWASAAIARNEETV